MVNLGVLYAIVAGVGALTIGVIGNRYKTTAHKELIDRKLVVLFRFLFLFCIADMIWGILTSQLLIVNQVLYTISTYSFHLGAAISAFLWAGYVIHYVGIDEKYVKTLNVCRGTVLSVQITVLVSNLWTHSFFSIDENAIYHSYQLRNFMFFMQFAYYIVLIVYGILRIPGLIGSDDKEKLNKHQIAMLYSCVPLAFGFGQMLWPDAPMYSLGFMLTSALIYSINITAEREENMTKIFQMENNRLTNLIAGLSDDFQTVYCVNLETNGYEEFGRNEFYSKNVSEKIIQDKDFFADLSQNIGKIVYHEDRDYVDEMLSKEHIVRETTDKKSYSFSYRLDIEGEIKYYLCKIVKPADEGADSDKRSVIIGVFDNSINVRRENIQRRALEAALEDARNANRAKTAFLFNMSHDIRTPMNAIIGFTSLAKKNIDNKNYLMECLDKVSLSGEHLLALINDVLDMSRIESGKMVIAEKAESIGAKNDQLMSIVSELAANRNVRFEHSEIGIDNEYIKCDALHVNQILLNILSNAIKYTKPGGKVEYTIEKIEPDAPDFTKLKFTVVDNGIGMSKEFLAHIYDEFERENNATMSGVEGTGLGMSIVRNLVSMMNGTIDIESEQGVGTKVVCILQFARSERPGVSEYIEDTDSLSAIAGKRVLLVDDNALNREIACEILEEMGLTVDEASNGKEAVETVKKSEPGYYDIVLMDIQMPIMNGYEATKEIRALDDAAYANIPIVAMTANAFEEDKQNAREAGMNAHLAKPIDVPELARTIRECL